MRTLVTRFCRGTFFCVYFRLGGRRIRQPLGTENRKIAERMRFDVESHLKTGEAPKERPQTPVAEFRKEYEELCAEGESSGAAACGGSRALPPQIRHPRKPVRTTAPSVSDSPASRAADRAPGCRA
jgi:hypothetical protein